MSNNMTLEELETIYTMACEDRYHYFLETVVSHDEIWILVNDSEEFLKLHSDEEELEYLPVWPLRDFAYEYSLDSDDNLEPKQISLPVFYERWIEGLEKDGLQVSVFPMFDDVVWLMEPADLQFELQQEFE